MHIRTEVRNQVAARLVGAGGIGTVRKSRVYPASAKDLPCWLVYSPSETVERAAGHDRGHRIVKRQILIDVVGVLTKPADDLVVDEELDDIAAAAEAAICLDPNLKVGIPPKSLVHDTECLGTDTGFSGAGSSLVAMARVRFRVTIHGREGQPSDSLSKR